MNSTTQLCHPNWRNLSIYQNDLVQCVLGSFVLMVAVFSVSLNGVIVVCYKRSKSLRNTSNMFIVNLAVADLIMSTIDFPMFVIASFLHDWPFGGVGCKIYGFLTGLAGLVTINSLAVIALDRYNAVAKRINNMFSVSTLKAFLSISFTWIYAAIFSVGPIFGWSDYVLEAIKSTCSFDFLTRDVPTRSFIIAIISCEFVVPMAVILWAYSQILREMLRRRKAFADLSERGVTLRILTRRSRFKSEIRTSVIIFGLVVLFSVAWMPYTIVAIIGQFGDRTLISPYVTIVSSVIAKTSTVSNPIVYAIVHPKFKNKIIDLFKNCGCRRKFSKQFSITLSDDSTSFNV